MALDAFFRLQIALPRLRPLPPLDGSLRGWPETARLPDLAALHFQPSFASAYAGWTLDGLALGFAVGHHPERQDPAHPLRSDGVEIWIDTRDSRTARKLTRFCHHFRILPRGLGRRPFFEQVRAGADGGTDDEGPDAQQLRVAVKTPGPRQRGAEGYALEVFLSRELLTGYAPMEATSIGLGYRVRSSRAGVQDLTFGERFPLWRNPSLWMSARLEGAG